MFKKIYNWVTRKNMPPIDPQRVQNKLNELNATGQPGSPFWIVAEGLRALTSMTYENGVVAFNPNNGIPLKVFVNTLSGELKLFDARLFTVRT